MRMANVNLSIFQAVKATLKRTCKCHGVSGAAVFRHVGCSWLISEKSVSIWKSNTIKHRSWRWTKFGWGLVTARTIAAQSRTRSAPLRAQSSFIWKILQTTAWKTSAWDYMVQKAGNAYKAERIFLSGRREAAGGSATNVVWKLKRGG